ncbi:MAG TPA: DNA-3-methyladenine glycosylase 2 family protein [Azospirillum sp.]|nr:DNA-3-methyladenine glycosylase 2 family protein [Azospirillum sp.]
MTPDHLASIDPIFAECVRVGGPLVRDFSRPAGFPGLLRIILEQQLSTQVAVALWRKLEERAPGITPESYLALDEATLKACGFSGRKIEYGRILAEAVASGRLDLDAVHAMEDEAAIEALVALKGIGRWSAEIYLMMALGRPDLWPVDDLAIMLGVQRLKGWTERPTRAQLIAVAEPWRPYRSLAAKLVWHHYVALQQQARQNRAAKSKP